MTIRVQCNYCSRFHHPGDFLPMPGGVKFCRKCYENHERALEVFAGDPPRECQGCQRHFDELPDGPDGNVLYVVTKDGIYQVLCDPCIRSYRPKRRDLYRGTVFGHQHSL